MDKRFLNTPSVALGQLKKETFRMADMAMHSLDIAFRGFIERNLGAIDVVNEENENIGRLSEQISDYLVKVSASGISLSDEKNVSCLHSNVGDIARIAELADNITKYTRREVRDNLMFSDGINEKLEKMYKLLPAQYDLVKQIVLDDATDLISSADEFEDETDSMRKELVAEHIARLAQGKCRPENNTVFINLVCNLERIGDHLNFIAHSAENGS